MFASGKTRKGAQPQEQIVKHRLLFQKHGREVNGL
jgi:hypothetical protein